MTILIVGMLSALGHKFDDVFSPIVAQVSNLLYRRFPIGNALNTRTGSFAVVSPAGWKPRDTAGWNPALRHRIYAVQHLVWRSWRFQPGLLRGNCKAVRVKTLIVRCEIETILCESWLVLC